MIQKRARLHEKAVQAAARGEVFFPPQRNPSSRVASDLTITRANPEAWKEVRRILRNNRGSVRAVIVSESEVLILNTPTRKAR